MLVRAKHFQTGKPIDLHCQEGTVQDILPAGEAPADKEGEWVCPGLFDLQINGGLGIPFSDATLDTPKIITVVEECFSHGITSLCPTLITNSKETLLHGFRALRQAKDADENLSQALPCFHLEGPFISPQDGPRGAHAKKHVRLPDWKEFQELQEASGGNIRLVTLAPELPGAMDFIRELTLIGVVAAIGHTAATPDCIRQAIKAGAKLSTHLGNGSHAVLPRHENYLWEQLAADNLLASFIPDGHHLPPAILRAIVRTKPREKLVITCDAGSLAGMPPGKYSTWGMELEVLPRGKVVVPGTPFLAGSGLFTDECLRHLISLGDVSLDWAISMAGAIPRKLLGLPGMDLEAGMPARLVLFQSHLGSEFQVQATLVGERWYSGKPRTP
ncbi:MAG: N-acetylglucosamine-6-phosphate deacetylase [Gemmataceae bacterium]|nr:N-acetylglucosamine-6-phosphate deacetylase [Gemmataceae bacterium]